MLDFYDPQLAGENTQAVLSDPARNDPFEIVFAKRGDEVVEFMVSPEGHTEKFRGTRLCDRKWRVQSRKGRKERRSRDEDDKLYAITSGLKSDGDLMGKTIYLHRLVKGVLTAPAFLLVDHYNGDSTDCRYRNLRNVLPISNGVNSAFARSAASGYMGVVYTKGSKRVDGSVSVRKKPWMSRIKIAGEKFFLGNFKTAKAAARARDRFVRQQLQEWLSVTELNEVLNFKLKRPRWPSWIERKREGPIHRSPKSTATPHYRHMAAARAAHDKKSDEAPF